MLDYMQANWPEESYFTEEEFIFASNETCMPYALAYHNQNNTILLSKYSMLLRKIAPWINYPLSFHWIIINCFIIITHSTLSVFNAST